jgi:hypothetical protein
MIGLDVTTTGDSVVPVVFEDCGAVCAMVNPEEAATIAIDVAVTAIFLVLIFLLFVWVYAKQ